jgi:hypothetical protein
LTNPLFADQSGVPTVPRGPAASTTMNLSMVSFRGELVEECRVEAVAVEG